MPAATIAADFWAENSKWIAAVIAIVLAVLVASGLDRALQRRGRGLAQAVVRGELTPEVDTRLRFVRRLLFAAIILLGVAVALSQFTGINRIAASLLASGALAAAIIGFAARQTLANLVAGIMLAVTQPVRVGDWVTFDEQYGVVEDVRLNYTVLRTPADARLLIPNEKLASGLIRNDTIVSDQVALDVAVWLAPEADAGRAVELLRQETGCTVSVAETRPEGVRLAVGGDAVAPAQRAGREAELRLRCLRRLRADGLLAPGEQGSGP
jgi:small-conductance mechanosensitive channel